jgi:D-alanine-D-alanine ligase
MRNQKKHWQILEVNTVPGMTETSLVPKAANAYGLSFSELVTKILQLSVKK